MGLSKSVNNLSCDVESCAGLDRLSGNAASKSLAIDVLHHDETAAIFFRDFVDRAYVRMIELGCRPRFTNKSLICLLICG